MTDGATAVDFSQKLLPAKIRLVARAADEKSERERATRRDVGKRVIRKEDAHGREKTREGGMPSAIASSVLKERERNADATCLLELEQETDLICQ